MTDDTALSDDLLKRVILATLVALPMVIWLAFVLAAGFTKHSATQPPELNESLRLAGVASGTALATIAGSFLGIKNAQTLTLRQVTSRFSLSINGWATLAYFVGISIAVLIWIFDKNRAQAAEVIQTSFATLFGFAIGALKAATTPSE